MSIPVTADPIAALLDPRSSREERKEAVMRLARESWERGWDECNEAYQTALLLAGVTIPQPEARA